jgi:hypothetical protein
MFKTENEIWEAVKELEGKTITTVIRKNPNHIIKVEDTGNMFDKIHVEGRKTKPCRQDVIEAYKTLAKNGELDRKTDLAHLAGKRKQTSSIIFAFVFEITRKDIELIVRNRRKLIVLKSKL